MQHEDLSRTGQNLSETTLTPANVNVNQFGLLFRLVVDNEVYAQPLLLSGLSISGGTHNVVFVATTGASVYAFDADSGTQYWHTSLGTPAVNTDLPFSCSDINGDMGVIGSPVIDPVNGILYVVATIKNTDGTFHSMLHALNVSTGADVSGSPVEVTTTGFNALEQNQRAALTLADGELLIPYGSHCDGGTYHGFLFAYNPTTLAQITLFNASPTGNQNSLWMSGQGPSVDSSGNIYFGTSNGTWDGVQNFSESYLKLSSSLALEDWFTAANHATLDSGDLDLDTSGPLLIPPGNRLFNVGKSHVGYVINTANLGHLGDASAVQTVTLAGPLYGSPIYWDGATNGPEIYVWAWGDKLQAYTFNGSTITSFQTGPVTISLFPGAFLALSANGNTNGVIWANGTNGDAGHGTAPGIFRAYNASNITTELWNSSQNATRDTCTNFSKDGYPIVANGKVYLPSFGTAAAGSGQVCVYGLLSGSCTAPTTPSGLTATATSSSQINLSWTASTSSCAVTYNIFRSTTSGFTPSSSNQIATGVTTTTYSNTGLAASTTYYYLVEGTNAGGTSAASNQASATTQVSSCTAAPTAPSGLTATAQSSSQINLSWTASSAGTGCSITYSVFRSTTSGFTPSSTNQIASGVTTTTFSNTGLAASTTYYYLVEGVDSAGSSAASNQANATTQAGSSGGTCTVLCIDSGSTTAVSPFLADEDFTGGSAYSVTATINTSGVTNPAPMAVYQTARQGASTYTIPGLTAGTNYTVRLHFAELYFTAAMKREFNVSINGTQVLTNFDIYATAGAGDKAVVEQFTATANSSGQIVIATSNGAVDQPMLNGVEIDSTAASCTAAPTVPTGLTATAASSSQINLSWTASTAGTGCTITYNVYRSTTSGFTPSSSNEITSGVTATSYSNTGLAASTTYYYLVEAVDSAGTSAASNQATATTQSSSSGSCTSICIDSGSTTTVSPFVADEDFTGGATIDHANTINTSNVTNPAPAAVYQTARVGNFTYTIGGFTAGSSHNVRLHFCETYFSTTGSRTFNVSINGTQVLTDFDIVAASGGKNIANIQQFSEAANSSGQYVIVFTSVVNQSLISGIEID
ncbi:MAG: malectin domain-containing carbohydrate-binding protein [Candidatus Acidiferrales bacterium]